MLSMGLPSVLFGMALGAGITRFYYQRSSLDRKETPVASPPQNHSTFGGRFGLPESSFVVKQFQHFALGYDRRMRLSTWAYEVINKDVVDGDAKRKNRFREDQTELEMFRAKLADYQNLNNIDRGHFIPAADFKGVQQAMDDSFILSNICPQDATLNRAYWARFEKFVRELTNRFDEVHVITGPLFLPKHDETKQTWSMEYKVVGVGASPVLRNPLLPIPTHFYKVVLGVKDSTSHVAAFVIPNEPVDSKQSLQSFQAPINLVEVLTGHLLFPRLLHPEIPTTNKEVVLYSKPVVKDLCKTVRCELAQKILVKQSK